jgi:ABC-type sulfate/molybdate transport systems ATPase subunit
MPNAWPCWTRSAWPPSCWTATSAPCRAARPSGWRSPGRWPTSQRLLLDEPTSALDPAATLTIEGLVRDLRDRLQLTFVWVTHNVEQARRVSDQTVLLVNGVLADWGETNHLLDEVHHDLVRRFAQGQDVAGLPIQPGGPHAHIERT